MVRKHFTALGEQIDMAALASRHADTVALGNARMNARGDVLGNNGTVLRTQEQISAEWKRMKEARDISTGSSIVPDIKAPLPDGAPAKKVLSEDQEFDPSANEDGPASSSSPRSQQPGRRRRMVDSDQ